ncbi:cytochrome P450 [Lentithecium fluviatile CBS 122367]|uniref:Cytochrome P450 n=1 Tax=Lentithecium fluviatile CBS 122367 TaxID=1168545 RepID=A0A6G1IM77_9PLEO|nr:cytochrome P450 [Lentithecium fluviatile CBS 122367]
MITEICSVKVATIPNTMTLIVPSHFQLATATIFGASGHLLYFIKGEHHLTTPVILLTYTGIFLFTAWFQAIANQWSIGTACYYASIFLGTHLAALFSSMIFYRLFFHPLRYFPGPLDMRISKLSHVFRLLRNRSKNYELLEKLRHQYGEFVRTGPNELTIFHPDILNLATRPGNEMQRSDWYDLLLPSEPMATTRNRPDHDARKKIFDRAFKKGALTETNDRITEHVRKLESYIAATEGHPVEIDKPLFWISFDIMGDFAFGRSFNTLADEKWRYAGDLLRDFMALLGPLTPVPWLCRFGMHVPKLSDPWFDFKNWCIKRCQERLENDVKDDIFHWMMNDTGVRIPQDKIEGDAIAIIIAGSDTSASVLVFLFYFLASRPSLQQDLRAELTNVGDVWNLSNLEPLPLLNATISETLRLYPPIPSSGLRSTGPSGLTVGDTFIPPGVTIAMPPYSFGRLEDCYERAEEFIPKRWTTETHLIKNRKAYHPFGKGRFSCPGRALALRELRLIVAVLLTRYNVSLAPGEDGQKLFRDLKDEFVFAPGELHLCFARRDI